MNIAFLTSELYPLAKTGGLGDVAGALTQALAKAGDHVTVYLPAYRSARAWCRDNGLELRHIGTGHALEIGGTSHPLSYQELDWRGVKLVLVENDSYFDRPHPYLDLNKKDYPDNLARFAFFCRATLEHIAGHSGGCDILHLNDWQTSLAAVYLRHGYAHRLPLSVRSVLTVHNLGYQGLFPVEDFPVTGLDWQRFHHEELEYYGQVNLLKGGLVYADALTTVSPTYATEIQTPAAGHGLDGVLRSVASKLHGILNGVDVDEWNPEADPHLPAAYSATDLAGKAKCKRALQRHVGLPLRPRCLLLGSIGRLDRQKGVDLIAQALPELAALDIQLVLLGSGSPDLEAMVRDLAANHPQQAAVTIGYDESLAHLMEAGADIFMMPSIYEPCGLNQMYSHRYGTLPLVRETGGLKDTVIDIEADPQQANGFTFAAATPEALAETVRRAAKLYFTNRRKFNATARRAMAIDHSWARIAEQYRELYLGLLAGQPSQGGAAQ